MRHFYLCNFSRRSDSARERLLARVIDGRSDCRLVGFREAQASQFNELLRRLISDHASPGDSEVFYLHWTAMRRLDVNGLLTGDALRFSCFDMPKQEAGSRFIVIYGAERAELLFEVGAVRQVLLRWGVPPPYVGFISSCDSTEVGWRESIDVALGDRSPREASVTMLAVRWIAEWIRSNASILGEDGDVAIECKRSIDVLEWLADVVDGDQYDVLKVLRARLNSASIGRAR